MVEKYVLITCSVGGYLYTSVNIYKVSSLISDLWWSSESRAFIGYGVFESPMPLIMGANYHRSHHAIFPPSFIYYL